MKKLFPYFLLFLALKVPQIGQSQIFQEKHFGFRVGLVAQLGTHVNQVGFTANAYAQYSFAQINLENTCTFSLHHLAKRRKMWENRTGLGALLLGGERNNSTDFIWGSLHHQTTYQNAVGYTYLWYRDNQKTSQNSGAWTLQTGGFQLFFENDIFAGKGQDRFRTGNLQLAYRYKEFVFQSGITLWTGETRGSRWEKVHLDKCPSGFRILEELPYGKTSHGLFYGGISYRLPQGNEASARFGIDSEQVRHLFQNRLSHDMILFPKFIERKTPHYPRLSEDGCAIFEKQSMRRNRFYAQFGLNPNPSY